MLRQQRLKFFLVSLVPCLQVVLTFSWPSIINTQCTISYINPLFHYIKKFTETQLQILSKNAASEWQYTTISINHSTFSFDFGVVVVCTCTCTLLVPLFSTLTFTLLGPWLSTLTLTLPFTSLFPSYQHIIRINIYHIKDIIMFTITWK